MSEEKNYINAFELVKKIFTREKEDLLFCEECRAQYERFINTCEKCGHQMNSQIKIIKAYELFKKNAVFSIFTVAKTNQAKANKMVDELTEVTTELLGGVIK